jgi:SPP1 gp7 family putative phage head morphogenesis protein
VSRVYKEDLVRGFKDEIETALKTGATQQQTVKRFKSILAGDESQAELGDFHLETVFRVNMGVAYGVGRRRGMEGVTDDFPFWEYHGVLDDRERPSHRALEGIIQRADNSFWTSHYPPWEFNCRCSAIPTDAIPEGYDPKNPSGRLNEYGDPEVDISYNDDGSPAKAEIGTSLIDLMVSRSPMSFRGVPPQGGLREVIEEGARRAAENRKKKPRMSAD